MTLPTDPANRHWSEHILVKMILIGFIILALMIPSVMIMELVRERANRKQEVTHEVSSKWGQIQTIAGPYISVPYLEEMKKPGTPSEWTPQTLNYFPATLNIHGELMPVVRKRSIFKVMLYESQLTLKGHFDAPDLQNAFISPENLEWEKATIHLGITDLTGIGDQVYVNTGDTTMKMSSAFPAAIQFPNGLVSRMKSADNIMNGFDFEISLILKGSQGIYFVPVANHTTVALHSSWPSPKFEGQFLPDSFTITKDGFEANWTVLDINRQLSQQWTGSSPQPLSHSSDFRTRHMVDATGVGSSVMGVELLETVDHYTKNERTVKYAFLLITLTFVIYFFSEVLKKQRVHPLQYGLVGSALVIFFILLLSLSEHIGFDLAYMVSSVATILLITLYSKSIFTEKRNANLVGGLLFLQFGFIYIILQLEDFALLAGSIALFAMIALIMYLTRKVQWQ
jgi:inner membrane protein